MARRIRANASLSSLRTWARVRSAVSRKTTVRPPDGLSVDPVECGVQRVETDSAPPSGLLGEVRGQRRAILQASKVIDIDGRDDGLAVLGDRDGTVGVPGLGDKLSQVCASRGQR